MNPLRIIVSVCLLAGILAVTLACLGSPVLSAAPQPATWSATWTMTGPTTITLPTQVISAVTTNGYVVVVLIGQDAQGQAVTQTLWTESTIGRAEPTVDSSWEIIVLLLIASIALASVILAWSRKHRARPASTSVFCTQCGAENPSTYGYCGKCGTKLKVE